MDLTAKPFRIFVRIAELRSFSRAAETLNMSQPALSAQLRELERQLGFPLFRRNSRKVELSPQGAVFLDNARRMIIETEWLNQAAAEIRTNHLRIGVPHYSNAIALRTQLTDSFLSAHPSVPIVIRARHPRQLLDDLADGTIDIAITLEMIDPSHRSVVEPLTAHDGSISIGTLPVSICIPDNSPLASGKPLEDILLGQPVAVLSRAHGIAISESIAHALSILQADIVHPPEGDAMSVFRHAVLMNIAAADLGWFDRPSRFTVCTPDWPLATALVCCPAAGSTHPAIALFLTHVRQVAAEFNVALLRS